MQMIRQATKCLQGAQTIAPSWRDIFVATLIIGAALRDGLMADVHIDTISTPTTSETASMASETNDLHNKQRTLVEIVVV